MKGNPLSWCNNHDDANTRIYEVLDRDLANTPWLSSYSSTNHTISPQIGLGHLPMLVSFNDPLRSSKGRHFRVGNYLLHNKDFQSFL